MRILKVWIIARNGLQLINANIHYENGEYMVEMEILKNGENVIEGMTRASGIASFQHFFEDMLIQKPCIHMLFEDGILLLFHRWSVHHYIPEETIGFTVLIVAHIDTSVVLEKQEKVLRRFCQLVGWEFYNKHQHDLVGVVVNIGKLQPFAETCETLAHLPQKEIDDRLTEFEKKLGLGK